MPPEQYQFGEVDHRADIWSVGVMLYEMLTGRLPFEGDHEAAIMYSIMNENPEPLTRYRTGIKAEMQRIVDKALQKDISTRYQNIGDMLADLQQGQESHIEPERTFTSVKKRILRIPSRVNLLEIFLFSCILFLSIGLIWWSLGALKLMRNEGLIDSIAVLPLQNLSGDPEQEYFADGMTDALITELSKIGALRVISRQSVMSFKGSTDLLAVIAKKLNVAAVVEGSVLQVDNKVRIIAQLIQVKPEKHIWAEDYERDLRDVLSLQKEVSRKIAEEITIAMTPDEQERLSFARKVNPEAYKAYLKGRFHLNQLTEAAIWKAINYFEQAIEFDSSYALAYAWQADAYNKLGELSYLAPEDAYMRAKESALKSLELDEMLAEAYVSLADAALYYDWDWTNARRQIEQAIKLNPNHDQARRLYAEYLSVMGQNDEAIKEMKHALALDPLSLRTILGLGWRYYFARKYGLAIDEYRSALQMDPNYSPVIYAVGRAYVQKGMFKEAISAFEEAISLSEGNTTMLIELGYAYAASGNVEMATGVLNDLINRSGKQYVPQARLSLLYWSLGEKDNALDCLELGYDERHPFLVLIDVEPRFDIYRSEPRFDLLLERMNFGE